MERVERVEELLLSPLLTLEELDVVYQEDIGGAVSGVKVGNRAALESHDEFVHELLG
jgi:hypothetical protein